MHGHKRRNVSIWYVGAILALAAGVLLKFTLSAQAQESEKKLFELVNGNGAQTLDIEQIERGYGFGTATIELDLAPDGKITNALVNPDAVRRGPEEFVRHVRDVMRTWEYTLNVAGSFYVTVEVPSPNERDAGKLANISVDLTNLRLPDDVTISLARKDAGRVVSQTGFLDQVTVTGAPARVQEAYKDDVGKTLGAVFVNLGPFFQALFTITAFAWLFCFYLAVKQVLRRWEPKVKNPKKVLGVIPVGATMFESDLVRQIQKMWVDSMRNTQLNADLFTDNKLTVRDISRIRAKLADATTVDSVKTALAEAKLTEMTGDRIFYKSTDEDEDEDIGTVKRSVAEKLKQIVELTPDKKKPVDDVLSHLDQCFDRAAVAELLNKHGFSPESMLKSRAASGLQKSPAELREDVSTMLNKLEEMQKTLSLNGHSNGQSPLSGQDLEAKEKEYEQFLWKHFGEPVINDALELCEKNREVPLCQIYESGLRNHKINRNNWWSSQEIDRSVDRTAAVKFEERRGVLDWLWAIGSLSPMFGLGGTVWGISQAFGKIKGVTDTRLLMQKLAGDINIALSTTIVGLVLGVLAFLTYYYTKYFLDQQAANIEKHFTEITNEA